MKKLFGKDVSYEPMFKVINDIDSPIVPGIDGIYINKSYSPPPPPNKYLVNEVKYDTTNNPNWKPKLDTTITKSGASQMQEGWIAFHLSKTFDKKTATNIMNEGYDAILTGVKYNGKGIIQYHIQDAFAKKLTKL